MDNPDFRTSDDIVWILCASQQNDKGRWVTIICRVNKKEYNVALYNISEKILTTLEKTSFTIERLQERYDLQEAIKKNN
ncbi:membrane protein [Salmonella enterica subsp. enterica]|uniref:Membrane protein n=1 Tax=Salmonella enterica I TaxID=59201 RepID=A0A3S4J6X5_SALET|nr:membrane protein [Salmonella enterica subsp. enterica]